MKDSDAEARAYALKLLSYRGRSRREMFEKLRRKGFDDGQINRTIDCLSGIGLMNDHALAADLYRLTTDYKYLGKKGIRTFLIKRGIGKDLIEDTLSDHTSDIEEKTALDFAAKRLEVLKKYPGDVVKRRLWGLLQRRGFSYEVIKKTVNELLKGRGESSSFAGKK